jgi:hypothetical protein
MRTTPAHDNVFDFNALLHPGTVFSHPRDVVADPNLSLAEKRAILASWASDLGDRSVTRAGRGKGAYTYR